MADIAYIASVAEASIGKVASVEWSGAGKFMGADKPASGWANSITCTIDHSVVDASLSYFPVLLYISGSSGKGSSDLTAVFDELGANSKKIKAEVGGSECYIEIERWDNASEKAWLWVRVPTVASGEATVITFYYDNSESDNDTYVGVPGSAVARNVWDQVYHDVYHLQETSNGTADEFVNSANATYQGTGAHEAGATYPGRVDGQIGYAQEFATSTEGEYIALEAPDVGGETAVALEAIFQPNDTATNNEIVIAYTGGPAAGHAIRTDGAYLECFVYTDGGYENVKESNGISVATWYYGAVSWVSGEKIKINLNATETEGASTITGQLSRTDADKFEIGNWSAASGREFTNGKVCEVRRVVGAGLSSAWRKANYYNCFDNFITFS